MVESTEQVPQKLDSESENPISSDKQGSSYENSCTESGVYTRDVYADPQFWNDRFKQQSGFFDWYANWKEMRPLFEQHFPVCDYSQSKMLMVGCGNSQLSAEMSKGGYPLITNIDISDEVINKMKEVFQEEYPQQSFEVVDATNMAYDDNSFDICIDKGTFDALACGSNTEIPRKLLTEMVRVCKVATVIVTSGTPEKRLKPFEASGAARIEYFKIEVSKLASLINILRTELKDKPLSHAMKNDHEVFKKAFKQLADEQRLAKLEQEMKTDPKKKLAYMMFKAAKMKTEQDRLAKEKEEEELAKAEQENQDENATENKEEAEEVKKTDQQEPQNKMYNPRRQNFCMMYILYKN